MSAVSPPRSGIARCEKNMILAVLATVALFGALVDVDPMRLLLI